MRVEARATLPVGLLAGLIVGLLLASSLLSVPSNSSSSGSPAAPKGVQGPETRLGALGAMAAAPLATVGPASTPVSNYSLPHWQSIGGAVRPPVRIDAAFAVDPSTGDGLLFGGYTNATPCPLLLTCVRGDSWLLDNGSWQNVTPTTGGPSARFGASLIFDPSLGSYLLFGGASDVANGLSDFALNDTWAFVPSTGLWQALCGLCPNSSLPTGRWDAGFAYDPSNGTAVLVGGETGATPTALSDTWTFSGGNWSPVNGGGRPSARESPALAFDGQTGELLLFGGVPATADTWTFNGSGWRQLSTATSPAARGGAGAATDPLNGTVLLYGGCRTDPCLTGPINTTWDFANASWHQLRPTRPPAPVGRDHAGFAADPLDQSILVVGGDANGAPSNGSWSLVDLEATAISTNRPALDVGETVELSVGRLGGVANFTYTWLGLPSGCSSQNSSALLCTPSLPGPYFLSISVRLSDRLGELVTSPPLSLVVGTRPAVGVIATPSSGIAPLPVAFLASPSGGSGNLSIAWSFGDGAVGTGSTIDHTFAAPGNFSVEVWANDSTGASADQLEIVDVFQRLNVTLDPASTNATLGASVLLSAEVSGGLPPYVVLFPSPPQGCTASGPTTLRCQPSAIGNYSIEATATDASHQSADASARLEVRAAAGSPPPASAALPLPLPPIPDLVGAAVLVAALVVAAVLLRRGERPPSPGRSPKADRPPEAAPGRGSGPAGGTMYVPPRRPR